MSVPLHDITTNNNDFQWRKNQHKTFEEITLNICETLVFSLPNLHIPFEVGIDACGYAMGEFLMNVTPIVGPNGVN